MTLSNGAQNLALIGADGAGKTTMSYLIHQWLSWKLDVRLYYLGSKQPSRRSELLYLLFRMARRGSRSAERYLGEGSILTKLLATIRQMFLYIHHLSIGQDRYQRYRISLDKSCAGSIVLYDRFPLGPPLDGPKIHMIVNGNQGGLTQTFARLEQNIYRKIEPPDRYYLLNVSPDVSLNRKPDHSRKAIEAKSHFLDEFRSEATENGSFKLENLNADLPFPEVVAQLNTAVWQAL